MERGAIDFHTHVQPSAAEGVAFQRQFGFESPPRTGTAEELLPLLDALGVERALMVPWMPAQDHVARRAAERGLDPGAPSEGLGELRREVVGEWFDLNQWAVDTVARHPDRLCCLVGLDPLLMEPAALRAEVARKLAAGAVGLKIAPMFLGAPPDDERVSVVFELAAEHGVFVLSQAGAHGFEGHGGWGHPRYFETVLEAWPGVDVQLAHLGLGAEDEVARLTARHGNLYADTSSRLDGFGQPGQWTFAEAAEWFRRIGIDRVVYGTNYPISDPARYLEVMRALPLRDDERQRVLRGNAAGILERATRKRRAAR